MTGPGVYVHVPFCASRCDYCAFATWTDRHHLRQRYVDACIAQLEAERERSPWAAKAHTVYVGGGTPSQLDPADLARLLGSIDRVAGAEITVEANPDDVSEEWAGAMAAAGVTRVSLGVQSLDETVLAGLGRSHRATEVAPAASALARGGIPSYSVDLIYGGAGETDASWRATLEGVLGLDPPPRHVSAYALTVEPGTPLGRDRARHPDDDVQAARYELADELLTSAGLGWYEVSNWAVAGEECRHNENYWAQGDYLAVGAAAHGHRSGGRWWNLRTPERYIEAVEAGQPGVAVSESLDDETRATEALELALRTRHGVPEGALDLGDPTLEGLVAPGPGGRVVLTLRGRLLANEVAVRLESRVAQIT